MNDSELLLARRPLWQALSNFYLDTELSPEELKGIALNFQISNLSLNVIKEIDLYEVFPLLLPNLFSTTGVWNGFDPDWLNEHCAKLYYKRNHSFHRLSIRIKNRFAYWMRKRYWLEVEKYYNNESHNKPIAGKR